MQSLDLLGLQRNRRIAPAEADIRMMAFSFRELTNLLNKGQRLPEIAKPEAPLDAVDFLWQLPVWGLCMKDLGLLACEWRYSPAAGSADLLARASVMVIVLRDNRSRALRPANCEVELHLREPSH
jgi:hypothetical protein